VAGGATHHRLPFANLFSLNTKVPPLHTTIRHFNEGSWMVARNTMTPVNDASMTTVGIANFINVRCVTCGGCQ
jgi:hypothetical protein